MKRNRTRLWLIAASLASFLLIGGTLAAVLASGQTTNIVSTGVLEGKINQDYSAPGEALVPGDSIDTQIKIENTGEIDMLARLQFVPTWSDVSLDASNIEIEPKDKALPEQWIDGGDGYYYYKGILAPAALSEAIDVTYTLDGEKTGNAYRDQDAKVTVKLESLQVPGNAVESLWEKSYADLGIDPNSPSVQKPALDPTAVTFTGSTFTFTGGTDLFTGFKDMTPGEVRSQTITVANSYSRQATVFLRAIAPAAGQTPEDAAKIQEILTRYATVTVMDGETLIYSGPVWGNYPNDPTPGLTDSMKNNINLGAISRNGSETLTVTLTLDPSMGNEYQDLNANIGWEFMADGERETPTPEPTTNGREPDTGDDTEPITTDPTTGPTSESTTTEPTTDDDEPDDNPPPDDGGGGGGVDPTEPPTDPPTDPPTAPPPTEPLIVTPVPDEPVPADTIIEIEPDAAPAALVDIGDGEVPLVSILGNDVPLFAPFGTGAWALVNLILCILGAIFTLITLIRVLFMEKRERKEADEESEARKKAEARQARASRNQEEDEEEDEKQKKRYRLEWLIANFILAVLGVFFFLLTEDWTQPMVLVDKWTIVNFIIFVVGLVAMYLVFKKAKILFEANNGEDPVKTKTPYGEKLKEPDVPEKQNAVFAGWYLDEEFKDKWDFDTKVEKSFTLYAKWDEGRENPNRFELVQ